jgi:hypothetical protein
MYPNAAPRGHNGALSLVALCIAITSRAVAAPAAPPEAQRGAEPAEGAGASQEELAKAVQNPVADLISVPFQENLNYNIGPNNRAQSVFNIQPVLPLSITHDWNLVTRVIVPLVYQPQLDQDSGGTNGLGDINPTFFVAPSHPGKLIWGVGPAFTLPTASQRALGSGRFGMGPSVVVLVQPKPWTIGALVNNIWTFAGVDDRPNTNQALLQYFVNYNLPHGWYVGSQPVLTANWKASSSDTFLIPFGASVGKIFKLGKLPLNGQAGAYWNAVRPDTPSSPTWQMRLQIAFLFPKQ